VVVLIYAVAITNSLAEQLARHADYPSFARC
jgi:hypothetical protein